MNAIHVRFAAFTASFRHPLSLTGMQISTPMPPFSTLLGLIGACAGRIITPDDTRIGFEFRASCSDREIERTNRFQFERGILREHRDGQSIMARQVHFNPVLDLYLTNVGLKDDFKAPMSTPYLGRSQDIAWIEFVRDVVLEPVNEGDIGPSMLPQTFRARGLVLRLPEWIENEKLGYTRRTGPFVSFICDVPTNRAKVRAKGPNLFHSSDMEFPSDAVYIHSWSAKSA
ncbi:MAG: CRISPR-associated protein Cas5 [Nitrososphaerota archaeon]|nr:CRISPR-associated protein Cas5 [Nitrososphaerota archaeon]